MKDSQGPVTKHKKIRIKLYIPVLLIVWWFSNFTLTVNDVCFTDPRINDIITIVQLADLHGAKFGRDNSRLIEKVEAQCPDLVIVTGDMYSNIAENSGRKTALCLMKALGEKFEVYYINGEHDSEDDNFYNEMEKAGVHIFNYKDEIITVKNTKLHLYGINNVYYSDTFNLNNAFEPDSENYSILMAHSSYFKKFAEFGADLSLCGDTHGGLFRLPVVGAVYDGDHFLPDRNGYYIKGTYSIGKSKLFISSGLGNYPFPVRFCNRPEIAVIKLVPETA